VSRTPRRPSGEEQDDSLERWLITYADMITLLMAFFIMMYAMSVVDLQKFEALSHAMGHVFGGEAQSGFGEAASQDLLEDGQSVMSGIGAALGNQASLVNEIRRSIRENLPQPLRDNVEVVHTGGEVTIRMKADEITFPAGEAELTRQSRRILEVIGPSLSGSQVLVQGHTCDLPISTVRFPSNWELSAQRAANVMVYLVRHAGLEPDRISAAGFADTRPLVANTGEANRARNRRVDIVLLSEDQLRGSASRRAADQDAGGREGSVGLGPVRLCPPIDLQSRYYQHTGRRGVDTPGDQTPGSEGL